MRQANLAALMVVVVLFSTAVLWMSQQQAKQFNHEAENLEIDMAILKEEMDALERELELTSAHLAACYQQVVGREMDTRL